MKMTEEAFLEKVRQGDNKAIKRLRKEGLEGIKLFLRAKGDNKQDPEELLQDAYLKLVEKLQNEKVKAQNVIGYYIGIAKNLWRKSKEQVVPFRDYQPEQLMNLSEDEIPLYENTRLFVTHAEKEDAFWQVFLKLDEKCRKLLKWRKGEKKSSKEIADKMDNIQESSVDKTVMRCKEKLIDLLKADPGFRLTQWK